MVGAVQSLTVTVCVAVAVLPLPSVTVHVTVVEPSGNAPGALFVTLATEQLSEVVGVPSMTPTAVHPLFVHTITGDGAIMVGLTVSGVTVTVTVFDVAVHPFASCTVTV